MKLIIKFLFLLMVLPIFVSCETANSKSETAVGSETRPEAADLLTVKLDIKGMTCEIGCAKLIQSKLYKTDGVDFAQVRFADSSGVVRYDANKLAEKDIIDAVERAGGGDLYRVKRISLITEPEAAERMPEESQ